MSWQDSYGLPSESNSLLGVKNRSLQHMSKQNSHIKNSPVKLRFAYLPHKGLDSSSTTVNLVKSNLSDDL